MLLIISNPVRGNQVLNDILINFISETGNIKLNGVGFYLTTKKSYSIMSMLLNGA